MIIVAGCVLLYETDDEKSEADVTFGYKYMRVAQGMQIFDQGVLGN